MNSTSLFSSSQSSESTGTSSSGEQHSPFSTDHSTSSENENTLINEDQFDSCHRHRSEVTARPNLLDQPHQISLLPAPTPTSTPRSRHASESSSSIVDELPICEEHSLTQDFFCYDCGHEACPQCIPCHHHDHNFEPVLTTKEMLEETERRTGTLHDIASASEKQLSRLDCKTFSCTNDIRRCFEDLRQLITARENQLLNNIKYVRDCRTTIHNTRLKEAKDAIVESKKIIGTLAENYRGGDMEYVSQNSRLAKKHLKVLRDLTKNPKVEEEDIFFFAPERSAFLAMVRTMGSISSSSQVAANTCNNFRSSFDENAFDATPSTPSFSQSDFSTAEAGGNEFGAFADTNVFTGMNGGFNGLNGNFNGIHGNYGRPRQQQQQQPPSSHYDNSPQYNPFQSFAPPNLLRSPAARTLPMPVLQNVATALASLPSPVEPNLSVLPYLANKQFASNSVPQSPRNPGTPISMAMMAMNLGHPNMDSPLQFPVSYHTERDYSRIKKPVTVFGKEGSGDTDLCRPWGVCCDNKGHVIVADRSNNRIQVFRTDGSWVRHFGRHGTEEGEFNRPAGVAIDYYGRIVVCDKDNHRVQVFTVEGKFVFMFGERGQAHGKFHYPWDVDVSKTTGIIAITDTRNHRIQLFTSNGMFLKRLGFESGHPTWKFFDSPRGITFTNTNTLMCTDFNNHKLFEMDFLSKNPKMINVEQLRRCELYRPQGMTMDSDGNILISDCRNNRIQAFKRNGDWIASIGSAGKEHGQFDRPSGIALTPDGKIAVVDFGNHRVQIF